MNKATILFDCKATLGEGPVWDYKNQLLLWVDIEGCQLHRYSPTSDKQKSYTFNEMLGAVLPMNNGNVILALEKGLCTFNLKTEILTPLEVLKNTDPKIRFNDGKIGVDKALWISTMDKNCTPQKGNLFSHIILPHHQHVFLLSVFCLF